MHPPIPPDLSASGLATALREDLASFGAFQLDDLLGPIAAGALAREQLAPARRVLASRPDPLAYLARLFLLGETLTAKDVNLALPATTVHRALAAHLIVPAGSDAFRAAVQITPTGLDPADGPAWIISDLPETVLGCELPPWHVLGLGGAARTLHALLPVPPAGASLGSVLDLGAGSGIQALTLAQRARRVVATDLSARALAFLRANIALCALPGGVIDVREGSLFEPVAGESFDVIVSNPPFVITPAAAYDEGLPVMEYRDSGTGAAGDELVACLVEDLGVHLKPGGRAIVLANWEVGPDEDPCARPKAWVRASEDRAGCPLDALVVRREFQDPAEYAEMWLRDGGRSTALDELYDAYLHDFASRDVRWIEFGYLMVARRVDARASIHTEVDLTGLPAPEGGALWRLFDRRVRLAQLSDADVVALHPRAASDVTMEHHFRLGEPHPEVITATQGGGLHHVVRCPTEMAGLLSAADGTLSVGQIAAALGALLDVDEADMCAACVRHARYLAPLGLISLD